MTAIGVFAIGYILSQFYRSFLAVLVPVLQSDLGMTAGQLSAASGIWFVTFALMQFPVGYWLDTYGPRRTAALLIGIAGGGGALLFGYATSGTQVIIAMGLIGIGCSPALMAPFYIFARNFDPSKFAFLGSTFVAVGTLGGVFSTEPLAAASEGIGWRATAMVLAAVTVAVAALIAVVVRDPPRVEAPDDGAKNGLSTLLAIRQLWPIFPCILFGYAVAGGIRGLWVGSYMLDIHGLDVVEIGRVTLYMAIALAAGTLFYGPLDRMFNTRKWVVLSGNFIVFAAVAWLAIAPPAQIWAVTLAFVVIGFFGSSYAVQMAHGKSFIPAHLTGRGVTLLNFFSIGGVGLMQFLTGSVFTASGGENGEPTAYAMLFGFYALTLGVALVIYLLSTDAPPRAEQKPA